jgi:hypothetical protein
MLPVVLSEFGTWPKTVRDDHRFAFDNRVLMEISEPVAKEVMGG